MSYVTTLLISRSSKNVITFYADYRISLIGCMQRAPSALFVLKWHALLKSILSVLNQGLIYRAGLYNRLKRSGMAGQHSLHLAQ
jgi:hypothetical protein